MTPYQAHQATGHATVRTSPNGVDVIEECPSCGVRFLHAVDGPPLSLTPIPPAELSQRLFDTLRERLCDHDRQLLDDARRAGGHWNAIRWAERNYGLDFVHKGKDNICE